MAAFFARRESTAQGSKAPPPRPVGHFYLDPRARVLHCLNEAARQFVRDGVPLSSADLRQNPLHTLEGAAATGADLPMQRACREGVACDATFLQSRPGAAVRHLHWSASPIHDAEGRVSGVLGSLTVGPPEPDWQVLAGLAHDMRTPLQTLRLMAPVLLTTPGLSDATREALQHLQSAAERASSVAMDVLEWCRAPVQGGRPVQNAWFSLAPVLKNLVAEQAPAADRKQIVLEADLGAAQGVDVCCDAVRLGRLLANLLANAVRYTPTGRVRFTVNRRQENGQPEGLSLQVVDTGTGMSAEDSDCIFQPFERGKAGKEGDSGGSGVGLAVVDRLVEDLGLTLEVYSEYGRGSSFELILPERIMRSASSVAAT